MDLFDRFYSDLESVKTFKYKREWEILREIEMPIFYANELVKDINSLPEFSENKHTKEDFTGFVKTFPNKDGLWEINSFSGESDIAYFKRGKLRYTQWNFKFNDYSKFYFKDDNFQILKGYGGSLVKGKGLSYVHINSKFKLKDFVIEFSRISKEKPSMIISSDKKILFFGDLDKVLADNLSEEIFMNYQRFYDFFKGEKFSILDREVNFDNQFYFEDLLEKNNIK